jgi:hypothetical protein
MVNQRRSLPFLGLLADIHPKVVEKMHVGAQFFFRLALAGGAQNKSAGIPARCVCRIRFSRSRSSSEPILRDTPTWSTVGM